MDPVQKIMEMVKKLEAEGMSPADAREKGMAMMMEMTGGSQPSGGPADLPPMQGNADAGADMAGTSADDMQGGDNKDMPGDIKTIMQIAAAKKGMTGVKPNMGSPALDR